jgi:hypothetical protein
MLSTLPARQRAVIVARDLEGRRPGEIAASLGLSLGAVDSLLLRARRRMATAWQAASAEHGAASMQVTTASLAATTAARPQEVGRVLGAVGNAVDRVSLHVANALGLTPGGSAAAHTLGRLVATGAVLAGPAVGLGALHPTTSPSVHRDHGGLLALPGGPTPAVPSTPAPATPATPGLSTTIPPLAPNGLPALATPPAAAPTSVAVPTTGSALALTSAADAVTGALAGATTTLGTVAGQAASAAGQAVAPVSSAAGSAVTATGGTVAAATHTLSGTLSSLLPAK